MKRSYLSAVLGFCLALCLGADSQIPSRLHFPQIGFSIAPLKVDAKGVTFTAVELFTPPSGNFAANVNVQVQAYADSMDNYIALSKQQLDQMKLQVIKFDKPAPDTCVFEYNGQMGEQKVHFYGKGILKSGTVFLATATTTEDQWASVSDNFKACVESLQLDAADAAQP
jgi:hypothetical protein